MLFFFLILILYLIITISFNKTNSFHVMFYLTFITLFHIKTYIGKLSLIYQRNLFVIYHIYLTMPYLYQSIIYKYTNITYHDFLILYSNIFIESFNNSLSCLILYLSILIIYLICKLIKRNSSCIILSFFLSNKMFTFTNIHIYYFQIISNTTKFIIYSCSSSIYNIIITIKLFKYFLVFIYIIK
jgi:hypothetical protein